MIAAFINFSVHSYPDRIDFVNNCLEMASNLCSKSSIKPEEYSEEILENIVRILIHPLEKMSIVVLNMSEYPILMNQLPFIKRKKVAISICEAVISTGTYLINMEIVDKLVQFILPLLDNETTKPDAEEMESEQNLIAKLMQFVESHDPQEWLAMIQKFQGYFVKGYADKKKITMPSLIGRYIVLIHRVTGLKAMIDGKKEDENLEESIKEKFSLLETSGYLSDEQKEKFSFKLESISLTVPDLVTDTKNLIDGIASDFPELVIGLGLTLAVTFSQCDTAKEGDELQFNICSDILERFEDEIYETKDKIFHLSNIIGSLYFVNNMSDENMQIIITNTKTYASSFLRKRDSCLML